MRMTAWHVALWDARCRMRALAGLVGADVLADTKVVCEALNEAGWFAEKFAWRS